MAKFRLNSNINSLFFLVIPTLFLVIGFLFFPDIIHKQDTLSQFLAIPLFIGLIILLTGFLFKKDVIAGKIKILGWIIFAFYWSVLPKTLYFGEEGDFVNAFICIIGVYVLFYFAYHEYLSISRKEKISCLNWIAGASAIAGIIYFGFELTPLEIWLREVVAAQSAALLNLFTEGVTVESVYISYKSTSIRIIFACTGVQSMVIFVGMILAVEKLKIKRMIYGLLVTVVPVYFLNLFRNALITYLIGNNITDFSTAHNIIGKGGSLIALVILLLILIRFVPEVFDEIMSLTDLPKRKGPIEKFFKRIIRK